MKVLAFRCSERRELSYCVAQDSERRGLSYCVAQDTIGANSHRRYGCKDKGHLYLHLFRKQAILQTNCEEPARVCRHTAATVHIMQGIFSFNPSRKHAYIILYIFYIIKTGVYRGIHHFSYFCSKHMLWVLVRTASARRFLRVLTIYVMSRNMKNIRVFYLKIFSFWR